MSSFGIWGLDCTSNCSGDLGPVSGQTCFLAGISGNLQPASGNSDAFVEQTPDGHWIIQIVTSGRPLGVAAVCIPGTASTPQQWIAGNAETSLGTTRGTRRCFLTGVRTFGGAFTSASDFVQVHTSGGSWLLGGNLASGSAIATAVCVNVPTAAADFGLVAGEGSSFLNVPIQDDSAGGWACGVKKIGGHFTANSFSDGAFINFDNGSDGANGGKPTWTLTAVNGKQVTTDCVN